MNAIQPEESLSSSAPDPIEPVVESAAILELPEVQGESFPVSQQIALLENINIVASCTEEADRLAAKLEAVGLVTIFSAEELAQQQQALQELQARIAELDEIPAKVRSLGEELWSKQERVDALTPYSGVAWSTAMWVSVLAIPKFFSIRSEMKQLGDEIEQIEGQQAELSEQFSTKTALEEQHAVLAEELAACCKVGTKVLAINNGIDRSEFAARFFVHLSAPDVEAEHAPLMITQPVALPPLTINEAGHIVFDLEPDIDPDLGDLPELHIDDIDAFVRTLRSRNVAAEEVNGLLQQTVALVQEAEDYDTLRELLLRYPEELGDTFLPTARGELERLIQAEDDENALATEAESLFHSVSDRLQTAEREQRAKQIAENYLYERDADTCIAFIERCGVIKAPVILSAIDSAASYGRYPEVQSLLERYSRQLPADELTPRACGAITRILEYSESTTYKAETFYLRVAANIADDERQRIAGDLVGSFIFDEETAAAIAFIEKAGVEKGQLALSAIDSATSCEYFKHARNLMKRFIADLAPEEVAPRANFELSRLIDTDEDTETARSLFDAVAQKLPIESLVKFASDIACHYGSSEDYNSDAAITFLRQHKARLGDRFALVALDVLDDVQPDTDRSDEYQSFLREFAPDIAGQFAQGLSQRLRDEILWIKKNDKTSKAIRLFEDTKAYIDEPQLSQCVDKLGISVKPAI